jgi:sigma-B regulation protein RsbU (phosphoserine phosphatase)
MRNSRYSTLLRLLLMLVAFAGLVFWGANLHDQVTLRFHHDQLSQDPFDFDADTAVITSVTPEAARAGLAKGDTLESLNGVHYTGVAQWNNIAQPALPGVEITFGFRRPDGSHATATAHFLPAKPSPDQWSRKSKSQVAQLFILYDLIPLLCMLTGYWVVFAKPAEPNAWLLLVLLVFPAVVFEGTGLATGGWFVFRGLYYNLFQVYGPLALLPFAIYFPERSRIDVKAPWFKWLIIGPFVFFGVFQFGYLYDEFYGAGNPSWLIHLNVWVDRVENALNLLCVILYLVILFDKLRSASTADARRRLRVLLIGTGSGLGALLIAFVLLPHFGLDRAGPGRAWIGYLGAALFLLAPLTLAYVVLVQRALDVSVLIRQGTKYGVAKATVWVVQVVLLTFVAWRLLVPLMTQKQQAPGDQIMEGALFLFLVFMMRFVFRKQSQNWLDKKFFREAYDSELVLSQLADEVRRYTDSEALLKTVSKCVAETLHVTKIGMFLRSGANYTMTRAVGMGAAREGTLALATTSSTIRNLNRTNSPATLYRQDPDAWYMLADQTERATLDEIGAELLLPLPGRNKLMGVMALGPKQSEAAYSKSDLQLLQILATQTGMALEMSELAHSLANEAALRERANREMEIAREVQERLFPQEMPAIPGASVAGACRPALGVGGDYYDVFPLEDGRLGLAIGDVSGKGISAALLMASLRASLRGVTLDNPRDFAKLMDKVNRLVYEASADNRYATFFFGALDPATRVLECVNAGHNAPLVLRQRPDGSSEILRLEADGPVVGLLPSAPYTEQRLKLEPGDILVTYTDGISEAMTHADEEWGEDRMMLAAASAPPGAKADEVLRTIFEAADKFTAGAPQHDDMTLLILRMDAAQA